MRTVTGLAALFLAFATWSTSGATREGLVPQHSEELRPSLTRSSKAGAATLDFTAFGRGYRLQLASNDRLARLAAGSSVQLYKGVVEGVPHSWARITVRDGLPRGMVWDGRELFIVEAAPDAVNDGAAGTVMYKLSDAVLEQGISFGDDAVAVPREAADAYDSLVGELRANTLAREAGVATQGVEISVLADAAFLARFANETQARDAILTRLNNVDGIFSSQIGVELQVESVEIAGDLANSLPAATNSSKLLEELGLLRRRTGALSATGLTHLFTGRDLDGDTAGVAYTLALCSPRYAASLSMVHNSVALDSLITAHEIGHVFGAPHDGTQQCTSAPQGDFIMTPRLDTSVTSFSQCSVDEIEEVLDSYSCVVDLPEPAPSTPLPGDGGGDVDGGSGNNGDSGGGGSLDPNLLALMLTIALALAGRARRTPRKHG
jgi:hypothetical protein